MCPVCVPLPARLSHRLFCALAARCPCSPRVSGRCERRAGERGEGQDRRRARGGLRRHHRPAAVPAPPEDRGAATAEGVDPGRVPGRKSRGETTPGPPPLLCCLLLPLAAVSPPKRTAPLLVAVVTFGGPAVVTFGGPALARSWVRSSSSWRRRPSPSSSPSRPSWWP